MTENSFVKSIDRTRQKVKSIEGKSHYISSILIAVSLALIILFTLLGGVNVNMGSTYKGDGRDEYVRQSFFQLTDAAFNSSMDKISAQEYVAGVESRLADYGVMAPNSEIDEISGDNPFHGLDFSDLIKDAKNKMGDEVTSINWLKYKYALSVVLSNTNSDVHKASWDGHVTVMLMGQTIFEMLIRFAIVAISLLMLVFNVIAIIKRKRFAKARLSLILLSICFFGSMIFRFGFICPDALSTIAIVLIPLTVVLYAVLAHALMDNRDFSFTMFIYNGVLLLAAALAFVFMAGPLFRVTDNYGASQSYGWNFLYDLLLGEGSYMAVPMSYFLQALIMSILLMMNIILCAALMISLLNRFMGANYQHNDKKSLIIGMTVYSAIIALLIGVGSANGSLRVSTLDLTAKINPLFMVFEFLLLGGMIAFCYFFKPKPIKKELVILSAPAPAPAPAPAQPQAPKADSVIEPSVDMPTSTTEAATPVAVEGSAPKTTKRTVKDKSK